MQLPEGHEKMSPVELALSVALNELRRSLSYMEVEECATPTLPMPRLPEMRQGLEESIGFISEVLDGVRAKNRAKLTLNEEDCGQVKKILLRTLNHLSYRVNNVKDLKILIEIARVFVEELS